MGYIQYAKDFRFWSSDTRDMGLNNLAKGPPEMVKVICFGCLAFNTFGSYTYRSLVYIDISKYL